MAYFWLGKWCLEDVLVLGRSKDYLLNGLSAKTIALVRLYSQQFQEDCSFNSRLDFLCCWMQHLTNLVRVINSFLGGGFNPFENIIQIGSFAQVEVKIKHLWIHPVKSMSNHSLEPSFFRGYVKLRGCIVKLKIFHQILRVKIYNWRIKKGPWLFLGYMPGMNNYPVM